MLVVAAVGIFGFIVFLAIGVALDFDIIKAKKFF